MTTRAVLVRPPTNNASHLSDDSERHISSGQWPAPTSGSFDSWIIARGVPASETLLPR
jgi:hypothetical protein